MRRTCLPRGSVGQRLAESPGSSLVPYFVAMLASHSQILFTAIYLFFHYSEPVWQKSILVPAQTRDADSLLISKSQEAPRLRTCWGVSPAGRGSRHLTKVLSVPGAAAPSGQGREPAVRRGVPGVGLSCLPEEVFPRRLAGLLPSGSHGTSSRFTPMELVLTARLWFAAVGSLEPSPPGCMHPSHWSRDSLPPSPWPHRRPGRWEPDAKAHGPQSAGPRGFSHSLAPALHA